MSTLRRGAQKISPQKIIQNFWEQFFNRVLRPRDVKNETGRVFSLQMHYISAQKVAGEPQNGHFWFFCLIFDTSELWPKFGSSTHDNYRYGAIWKFWIFKFSTIFENVEPYMDRAIHSFWYVELNMDFTVHIFWYIELYLVDAIHTLWHVDLYGPYGPYNVSDIWVVHGSYGPHNIWNMGNIWTPGSRVGGSRGRSPRWAKKQK